MGAIHYRSRHDDTEDCWALYDHTPVTLSQVHELSPQEHDHKAAMHDVASTWSVSLPPEWR